MKTTLLTFLLCLAVASSPAMAQSKDEHSAHHPQGQAAPLADGAEAPPPGAPANAQPGPSPVDQGMKHLQDLMTQIEQSSDPAQREMLLHEHMIAMLEQLKLLRSQTEGMNMAMMMGDGGQMGMMGGKKKKSGMKSSKKDKSGGMMCSEIMGDGMMGPGMMGMHKMMEKRLSMVEQLLEQSIEHAHMREAAEH